ncbi:MAG: hypothetical protein N0E48_02980, partial [Candidatus Thiodiazotropha endolucinida]|nr:hypothetical protein [Candidatus Thiodiazotropha taylori]MCW4342326.1 hypothetical protein [Candidatus Thiodiazotropha endolucinida]
MSHENMLLSVLKDQIVYECEARVKILMFSTHMMNFFCYLPQKSTYRISSSVLKMSDFSRVRSTSENSDIFHTLDE